MYLGIIYLFKLKKKVNFLRKKRKEIIKSKSKNENKTVDQQDVLYPKHYIQFCRPAKESQTVMYLVVKIWISNEVRDWYIERRTSLEMIKQSHWKPTVGKSSLAAHVYSLACRFILVHIVIFF